MRLQLLVYGQEGRTHAGAVDDTRKTLEVVHGLADGLLTRGPISDVKGNEQEPAAQLFLHLLPGLLVLVTNGHVGALRHQEPGRGKAEATGSSRDEVRCALTVHCHGCRREFYVQHVSGNKTTRHDQRDSPLTESHNTQHTTTCCCTVQIRDVSLCCCSLGSLGSSFVSLFVSLCCSFCAPFSSSLLLIFFLLFLILFFWFSIEPINHAQTDETIDVSHPQKDGRNRVVCCCSLWSLFVPCFPSFFVLLSCPLFLNALVLAPVDGKQHTKLAPKVPRF